MRNPFRLACCLIFLLAATHGAGAEEISDSEITQAVNAELTESYEELVDINIETTNGIVTLTGSVDNLLYRERAAVLAGTLKGVRAVINRLEVEPVDRSDKRVRSDVREALRADPVLEEHEVTVEVDNGVVALSGSADSRQERQLYLAAAKGIKGVKAVRDNIRVQPEGRRPDADIRAEIKRVLEIDFWLDASMIEVTVQNGRVNLDGYVGSAEEKARARSSAWVAGVSTVDASGLAVNWKMKEPMKATIGGMPSEEEIQKAVEDSFAYDPRIDSEAVGVEVDDGTVRLSGRVGHLRAKAAAEENALHTAGVRRVKNDIQVHPPKPVTDDDLRRRLEQTLERDAAVDRSQVDLSVINQTVYLYGTVDSAAERRRAAELISAVAGVTALENHLKVGGAAGRETRPSDQRIRSAVIGQLQRSPYVAAGAVQVTVREGAVRLTGEVSDWRAFRAAEKNAYEGGAVTVQNELKVESP